MEIDKNKRIAVAMSGGVDSSAAALVLKKKGYDVIGISMKLWEGTSRAKKSCCSLEDFRDARRVADRIGIPYYVVNMQEEFLERVINPFISDYVEGKTPNPCVLCNSEMKFDLLLEKAAHLGADYLATGHYAIIEHDKGRNRYILKKGRDESKDQSYFLFSMTQEQLAKVRFPLGHYVKDEVRDILRDAGIAIADKEESQDICFVEDGNYSAFIDKNSAVNPAKKGNIVSEDGEVLGEHEGIYRFTIGQRRGLGISSDRRLYVTGFDYKNISVIVGDEEDLMSPGLIARDVNWIAMDELSSPLEASVKIRYSHEDHKATLSPIAGEKVDVRFVDTQRAVTPGQAVVFFKEDEILGGGWIESAIK